MIKNNNSLCTIPFLFCFYVCFFSCSGEFLASTSDLSDLPEQEIEETHVIDSADFYGDEISWDVGEFDSLPDLSPDEINEIGDGMMDENGGVESVDSTEVETIELPENRFGIGLVGPGNPSQWDFTHNLTGDGGYIKLIFPGVEPNLTSTPGEWVDAVCNSYSRSLIPVIRIGPPWGDRRIRNMSDDGSFTSYTQIANKYAMVVSSVLSCVPPSTPIYFEIHNEPNLCYEWPCQPGEAPPNPAVPANWMHYSDMAKEYAFFLRDVSNAMRAIGDSRVKITNGGLAPGGVVSCECNGDGSGGFNPGITALDFIREMQNAVSDIWDKIDAWATHSYPASGLGYGFFDRYENCGPGLRFFENELSTAGRSFPVLITETGWTIHHESFNWSREEVADWTVRAYQDLWLVHPSILGVMPFMLQDPGWDNFAWVDPSGNPYPVYNAVRSLRCSLGIPPC